MIKFNLNLSADTSAERCGMNEVYDQSGRNCYCDERESCEPSQGPGCYCSPGYFRASDGSCVQASACGNESKVGFPIWKNISSWICLGKCGHFNAVVNTGDQCLKLCPEQGEPICDFPCVCPNGALLDINKRSCVASENCSGPIQEDRPDQEDDDEDEGASEEENDDDEEEEDNDDKRHHVHKKSHKRSHKNLKKNHRNNHKKKSHKMKSHGKRDNKKHGRKHS